MQQRSERPSVRYTENIHKKGQGKKRDSFMDGFVFV